MRFNCAFLLIKCFLFTFCFADSDSEQKEKFLNGFLGYLNNIPNRQYNYEGFLINAQKINDNDNCYHIEANLKAVDVSNIDVFKYVKCSATIQDLGEGVNVQNNEYICIDNDDTQQTDKNLEEFVDDQTTSAPIAIVHEPVHLDNEVQPDSGVTSGEQFIAVPRRQAGGACVGCSSHVNPQAPGVSDLAALAIRHLDRHEPAVKHYLETVLDVERQVQVVNGVRYILTLQIKSNNCSSEENPCIESKTCKISILEKSWIKLPDGSKYRAILSNNCTEEWQFGDEGEFIPNNNVNSENNDVNLPSEDNDHVNVLPKPTPDYDKIANTGSADEILKAIHNIDVQAVPQQEKILTEEDIKYIEQQIIPHNNRHQAVSESQPPLEDVYPSSIKVHQISDSEAVRHDNDRPLQYKPVEYEGKTSYISEDKRKAIDDLINFFNSAGFDSTHTFRRARRSYENDIKVMSLAEKVHKIKKNIQNAQDLYILAQKLVDYMNKNEIGVTNKVLQDVIAAEEEFENLQHFIYIQVRVVIPCDNGICQDKSVLTKICNGIIEDTDEEKPHILSAFCYDEKKKNNQLGKAEHIPTDDPVLLKLSKEALKKIETESSNANAMKIDQILEAYTRKASGRLTNISLRLVYVNCTKEIPYMKRINCTVLHNMDANICEVSVHERHWLKEKTITYKCTPHPVGDRFVKSEQLHDLELSVNDSKVLEMIDETLLHLEFNSNRNNRQKLNKINSVRTQLVSGLLTQIDFDVVYTKCSFDDSSDLSMCEVLENEPARNCKAEIWDRPWLEDGRQIKVSCNIRKKRSSNYFVGGATTKDPKDPKYLLLSTESLRSYRETNYISEEYEVVGVESASEQVVAGILTKIAFKIRPKNGQGGEILCHSTIWSRPWLHSTNYNVTCDDNIKSINKRDIAGGEHVRDPKDPKFKEYASKSMQKYLESAGIKKYHKLIEIQSASEQVVSGKLIKLKFRISPTDCELGGSLSNCDIIDASNVLLCHSEIHEQVWLQKQDIDVTCEKEDKNLRVKRQIPGGPTTKDPKDPEYFALATESLRKFTQTNGIREEYEVLSVESASAQVVAGTLTKLTFKIRPKNGQGAEILCHSSIWSRPWLHSTEHTVTCDDNIKSVKKRDIVGGEHVRDPNDPKFKEYASKSMQKYLESAGIKKYHKLIEIQSASEQVVSGKLIKLKFRISPTDCELGGSLSNCDIIDASNVLLCHSEIHEQVWLQKQDIDVTCEKENKNSRVKRQIPGGFVDHDPNDPKYQRLAQASLKKYLKSKNSVRHHEILKIESASTQVVAGLNTLLRYIITPTTCLLDSNLEPTSTNCLVLDNDNVIYCYAEIWTQPWADKEETTVKCNHNRQKSATFENFQENYNPEETVYTVMEHGDSNRQRRSLKGSTRKENPNNKEFKIWAEKSFRKYLKRENLKFSHSITVNRVTSQLVSGKIYKIDYIAVPRSCASKKSSKCDEDLKHYCHAEILHRPWREGHKIDVHCDRGIDSDEQDNNERRKRDILVGAPVVKNINDEYKMLAEECLAKYQQLSNTKYVHKIIKVHNVTTQVVAGTLTKLDFSISPTKCLIEDNSVTEDCVLQKPKNTLRCQADVWYRPWLQSKEINVDCKKQYSKNLNNNKVTKQQIKVKRQVVQPEDDYIDEDTKYYYADRAVQYINDKADTNNLQKLITIHAFQNSLNMGVNMVKMYIETAYTYCLRHQDESDIPNCEELTGMHHRLCYVRLWPSPDDDLVVDSVAIVCNDEEDFTRVTGLSMKDFLKRSVDELESSPKIKNKLISLGEKFMIPSFDSKMPIKLNFLVSSTNCSKQVDRKQIPYLCFVDTGKLTKSCTSYIWMTHNYKKIKKVVVNCGEPREYRRKRSVSLHNNMTDAMLYEKNVQELVKESLEKLEMSSNHNYKQRVLQLNSYNSKITTGKLTVIDFDVGYTNCLKYEWVDEITKCEFMEHLPKRHCTSHITERLWSNNGKKIEVECHDIEAPLEAHIEFDNPEKVSYLANQALKHIEAKYLNPFKQKVVRVLSIERQEIAGLHYRMKLEVGVTDCYALSARDDCKFSQHSQNKMCNANIWLRTWTDLPALYRVSCDHQEGTTDHHRDLQAGYLFADFLATYKPDYVDDHEKMRHRYNIFKENIKKIHEFNTHEKGTAIYGVTRFSDLTYGEFSRKYLGLKPSLRNDNHIPMTKAAIPQVELPDSFDWRHYNAVTEVKDQGSCGSCWAFSVTGNVEGQWKIKTGDLVSLSEQELVDCDKLDDGCNGGLPDNAYRAIEQLGGLETESDYPYEGENDKCSFNKTLSKVQITGAVNITSNETDMAKWLVKNGPISIGINANAMQFYVGGVSHPWKFLCSPSNLDHGVLIVGYGAKDYPMFHKHMPYWIVKNSWGTSWGEQGYYRVYRGDGTCGVNQMASSSVV